MTTAKPKKPKWRVKLTPNAFGDRWMYVALWRYRSLLFEVAYKKAKAEAIARELAAALGVKVEEEGK